jgi:site-specific DNA recombinase
MGGHATHGVLYYRCYRKSITDKIPLDIDGNPQPCSCPEIRTEVIEKEVWDTVCQLIREPDYLIEELGRHNGDDSQKEVIERELKLCQARLKAIPEEQRRLVEGYRKGLYADFMMREDMDSIQKEQGELERRKNELERKLAQRYLTEDKKVQIRQLAEDMGTGLDNLDFAGKQELLRLLVEKVIYDGQSIEIQTIVRPREQLHPIGRGSGRGCTM